MTSEELKGAWGRKVYFLYPHSVFSEELFLEILSGQYEVYVIKNHEAAWRAAGKYPGSIIFVNIDGVLKDAEWRTWIRALMADPQRKETRVGILTDNPDQAQAHKYLADLPVSCGYIQLRAGLAEIKKMILKTLEANEARGKRRFVRAKCDDPRKAAFNIRFGGKLVDGAIRDISAAGMSFNLDKPLLLKPNTILDDIQLKLRGVLCRAAGLYVGEIKDGPRRHLLMFRQPVPRDTVDKVHRFIFHSLQQEMDSSLGLTGGK